MPITDKKIAAFTKKVADLADKPNQGGLTAAQVKYQFDAAPEELRTAFNSLIDLFLAPTVGDSGAHNIGSAAIDGVTGETVYDQLVSLKQALNNAVTGTIPDGSITPAKLAETAKSAQNISIADMNAHFTSVNVEGALDELFTYANDGKAQVASAVTAKGVAAGSTDSFSTLATKIGQISTGKKSANGTTNSNGNKLTVTGLTFSPRIIIAKNTAQDNGNVGNGGQIHVYVVKEEIGTTYPMNVYFNNTPTGFANDFTTTANGFSVTVLDANRPYKWLAIG